MKANICTPDIVKIGVGLKVSIININQQLWVSITINSIRGSNQILKTHDGMENNCN